MDNKEGKSLTEDLEEIRRDAVYQAVTTGKPYLETLEELGVRSFGFVSNEASR